MMCSMISVLHEKGWCDDLSSVMLGSLLLEHSPVC